MTNQCHIDSHRRVILCDKMHVMKIRRVIVFDASFRAVGADHIKPVKIVTFDRPASDATPIDFCPFCGGKFAIKTGGDQPC
jgi:hypothetical protein